MRSACSPIILTSSRRGRRSCWRNVSASRTNRRAAPFRFQRKSAKVTSENSSLIIGPITPAGRFWLHPSFSRLIELFLHRDGGVPSCNESVIKAMRGGYRFPQRSYHLSSCRRFSSGSAT